MDLYLDKAIIKDRCPITQKFLKTERIVCFVVYH